MRRSCNILLVVLAATGSSAQDYRFTTDVNQVLLPVTVTDSKGHPVTGLRRENFRVFDEGQQQEIRSFSERDVPVTVGLVVDASGSMAPRRTATTAAALNFVRRSNPEDEVFVVNFNEHVQFGLPAATAFTSDPAALREALGRAPDRGRTALFDAIHTALARVNEGSRDRKALIVVSDGGDNASHRALPALLEEVRRSNVVVYCVGIGGKTGPDRNFGVLRKLARITGGMVAFPDSAGEIDGVCTEIAGDLRSQYVIGYVPARETNDRGFRHVEVRVTGAPARGRLLVRTRSGYYLPETAGGTQ